MIDEIMQLFFLMNLEMKIEREKRAKPSLKKGKEVESRFIFNCC